MPQPIPKHIEINNDLTERLAHGEKLSQFEFFRFLKHIEPIRDKAIQTYLYAMLYAANGEKDKAIPFFESAVDYGVDIAANNYMVFINAYGAFSEVYEVSRRLADRCVSEDIYHAAFQSCLFSCEFDDAQKFLVKYEVFADDEKVLKARGKLRNAEHLAQKFMDSSGLSIDELHCVAWKAFDVADANKTRLAGISWQVINEEKTNSLIVMVRTTDPELLALMNLELSFSLVDNENLLSKTFSTWYQGISVEGSKCL